MQTIYPDLTFYGILQIKSFHVAGPHGPVLDGRSVGQAGLATPGRLPLLGSTYGDDRLSASLDAYWPDRFVLPVSAVGV